MNPERFSNKSFQIHFTLDPSKPLESQDPCVQTDNHLAPKNHVKEAAQK